MWSPSSYIAEVVASKIISPCEVGGRSSPLVGDQEGCFAIKTRLNDIPYVFFFREEKLKNSFVEGVRSGFVRDQFLDNSNMRDEFQNNVRENARLLFGELVDDNNMLYSGSFYNESLQLWLLLCYVNNNCPDCLAISSPSWIINISSIEWKVTGIPIESGMKNGVYALDTCNKFFGATIVESQEWTDEIVVVGMSFHSTCAAILHLRLARREKTNDMIVLLKNGSSKIKDIFYNKRKSTESITDRKREFRSTQVWNCLSHSLQAIKTENSADTFHHLQSSHNETVFHSVLHLTNKFPCTYLTICILLSTRDLFLQRVETTHIFSDNGVHRLMFSIPQCSPSYNHVVEKSSTFLVCFFDKSLHDDIFGKESHVLFPFSDTVAFNESKFRVPQVLSGCLSRFSVIHTEMSFRIGDCSLIIGEIENANDVMYYVCEHSLFLSTKNYHLFFPSLCLAVHRNYGLVGVMGMGCILSSHFPPTFSVLLSSEHTPFSENDVEPNVTLFFFRKSSEVFMNRSFLNCIDELPFPVSPLNDNRNNFGCEVKGVILRMDYVSNHILLTLSVSEIIDKYDLLCCLLNQ